MPAKAHGTMTSPASRRMLANTRTQDQEAGRLVKRWCLFAAFWLLPLAAGAQDLVLQAGAVASFVGQAYVDRQGQRLPAAVGLQVQRGDRLVTGNPGGMGLTLMDDTRLTLGADSRLELTEFRFNAGTKEGRLHVRLISGALHVVTGLIARSAAQNVRVETASGVMAVRGTAFIVEGRTPP